MRIKNLRRGAQWGSIKKNSTPSPWKRRKTTSSAIINATGVWGLITYYRLPLNFFRSSQKSESRPFGFLFRPDFHQILEKISDHLNGYFRFMKGLCYKSPSLDFSIISEFRKMWKNSPFNFENTSLLNNSKAF